MTNPLMEKTNEELVDALALEHQVHRVYACRQTIAQQEAAEAAKETALYTRRNARYVLASVIVLGLSSLGTFILAAATYLAEHPK